MTPSQENEVLKYLRADEGKLDKLIESQQRLSTEFLLMKASVESDFKVFGHRLAGVEARVGNLERDAEVTGKHNIEALQKQLDDAKKSAETAALSRKTTWWEVAKLVIAAASCGGVVDVLHRLFK